MPEGGSHKENAAELVDHEVSVELFRKACLTKAVSRTLLAPMDRIKYILQCQDELRHLGTLQGSFRGAWHCARHLASVEGYRSFWRGNLINVVSLFPVMSSHVFIAIPTQTFVFNAFPHHSAFSLTMASYAASFSFALTASLVSYPFEFARLRLAVDIKPFKGASYEYAHSLRFFSHPVFSESPHVLYRGLGLFVMGSLVYQQVYFGMYCLLSPFFNPESTHGRFGKATQVLCAITVSLFSTLCLHPIDTLRRRMMIAAMEEDLRYNNAAHCFRHVMRTNGLVGLYRGAAFAMLRTLAAMGIVRLGLDL